MLFSTLALPLMMGSHLASAFQVGGKCIKPQAVLDAVTNFEVASSVLD